MYDFIAQKFIICAKIGFIYDMDKLKLHKNIFFCAVLVGLIMSFAEDAASDADEGASLFDG